MVSRNICSGNVVGGGLKGICNVCNDGTCGVRGLYGELLSRSARMLVRESISASRLERLSSIVFPGPFI